MTAYTYRYTIEGVAGRCSLLSRFGPEELGLVAENAARDFHHCGDEPVVWPRIITLYTMEGVFLASYRVSAAMVQTFTATPFEVG